MTEDTPDLPAPRMLSPQTCARRRKAYERARTAWMADHPPRPAAPFKEG